jgi:hypothetical protein
MPRRPVILRQREIIGKNGWIVQLAVILIIISTAYRYFRNNNMKVFTFPFLGRPVSILCQPALQQLSHKRGYL